MASTNVRLFGSYRSEGATATATATAAGYDPQNTVDLRRQSYWRGVGTGSQQLILHTAAAITPTALGIAAGNYSGWGTAKLQHGTDATTWTDFLTLSGLPSVDDVQDYAAVLASAPSKSWWALKWAAPSAVPQVGVFYLGDVATLIENPWFGMDYEDDDGVFDGRGQDRSVVAERWGRDLEHWNMNWDRTTDAMHAQLRDFLRGEGGGRLRPFWYAPRDDAAAVTAGRAYLVRRAPGGWRRTELSTGQWKMSLPLEEQQ